MLTTCFLLGRIDLVGRFKYATLFLYNFLKEKNNEDQLDRSPPHVPGIPGQEAGGLQGTLGQVASASCKTSWEDQGGTQQSLFA